MIAKPSAALLFLVVLLALIDVGFTAGQHEYTIHASLWSTTADSRRPWLHEDPLLGVAARSAAQ